MKDSNSITAAHMRNVSSFPIVKVDFENELYSAVAQSPDGAFRAVGDYDGVITLHGPKGSFMAFPAHESGRVSDIRFVETNEGLRMLSTGEDGRINLYSISYNGHVLDRQPLSSVQLRNGDVVDDEVSSLAVDAEMGLFAYGTVNGNVNVRSLETGVSVLSLKGPIRKKEKTEKDVEEAISGLYFDPSERQLAVVGLRGTYVRFNLPDAHAEDEAVTAKRVLLKDNAYMQTAIVSGFVHSHVGMLSIVGRSDGAIELHDALTHEMIAERKIGTAPISALHLSEDGDVLIVGDADGDVYIIDTMAKDALTVLHDLPCPQFVARRGYSAREVRRIDMDPDAEHPAWIYIRYNSGHELRYNVVTNEEMELN